MLPTFPKVRCYPVKKEGLEELPEQKIVFIYDGEIY